MNRTQVIVLTLVIVCAAVVVSGVSYFNNQQLQMISADIKLLELKIDKVQKASDQSFASITSKINSLPKPGAAAAPTVDEGAASTAYNEIGELVEKGDFEAAKAKCDEFLKQYGASRLSQNATQLKNEVSVIGQTVPAGWGIEKWYQGEKNIALTGNHTTLMVFWETWCHYCMQEAPNVEARYEKYKGKGLQVIGITKVNRGATDEKVMEFIKEKAISYAIAKEDSSMTKFFNVRGIPAAAVIKDGKIIWRGHPARLSDSLLESYLGIAKS